MEGAQDWRAPWAGGANVRRCGGAPAREAVLRSRNETVNKHFGDCFTVCFLTEDSKGLAAVCTCMNRYIVILDNSGAVLPKAGVALLPMTGPRRWVWQV